MIFTDWSADWSGLEQKRGIVPFLSHHDWSKSRLTQRLEQLEQNARKTAEDSHWHGRCNVRACCGLLTPFGGITLAVVGAREVEPVAAASVLVLRLGYAPDVTLGRYGDGG